MLCNLEPHALQATTPGARCKVGAQHRPRSTPPVTRRMRAASGMRSARTGHVRSPRTSCTGEVAVDGQGVPDGVRHPARTSADQDVRVLRMPDKVTGSPSLATRIDGARRSIGVRRATSAREARRDRPPGTVRRVSPTKPGTGQANRSTLPTPRTPAHDKARAGTGSSEGSTAPARAWPPERPSA